MGHEDLDGAFCAAGLDADCIRVSLSGSETGDGSVDRILDRCVGGSRREIQASDEVIRIYAGDIPLDDLHIGFLAMASRSPFDTEYWIIAVDAKDMELCMAGDHAGAQSAEGSL